MSATQFKNDLTQSGTTEESKAASNAGMNFALILTLVLSLVFILWALAVSNPDTRHAQWPTDQYDGQLRAPSSPVKTSHTTNFNGRQVSSDNDKSYVDGTETQAAPPSINVPSAQ